MTPNALLVIAPRHPERFVEVERLCRREGLATVRRSELTIDAEPRADAVVVVPAAVAAAVAAVVDGSVVHDRAVRHYLTAVLAVVLLSARLRRADEYYAEGS